MHEERITYSHLMTDLTAHLTGIDPAQAEQLWRDVLTHYRLLAYAMEEAPQRMVNEAHKPRHRRSSLEVVAVTVLVKSNMLDFWAIRAIVESVLQTARGIGREYPNVTVPPI